MVVVVVMKEEEEEEEKDEQTQYQPLLRGEDNAPEEKKKAEEEKRWKGKGGGEKEARERSSYLEGDGIKTRTSTYRGMDKHTLSTHTTHTYMHNMCVYAYVCVRARVNVTHTESLWLGSSMALASS